VTVSAPAAPVLRRRLAAAGKASTGIAAPMSRRRTNSKLLPAPPPRLASRSRKLFLPASNRNQKKSQALEAAYRVFYSRRQGSTRQKAGGAVKTSDRAVSSTPHVSGSSRPPSHLRRAPHPASFPSSCPARRQPTSRPGRGVFTELGRRRAPLGRSSIRALVQPRRPRDRARLSPDPWTGSIPASGRSPRYEDRGAIVDHAETIVFIAAPRAALGDSSKARSVWIVTFGHVPLSQVFCVASYAFLGLPIQSGYLIL